MSVGLDGDTGEPQPLTAERRWPCLQPWISFQILDAEGNVYPCCFSRTRLGNVERDDWDSIWNGHAAQALRRDLASGEFSRHCRPHCPILASRDDAPGFDALSLGLRGTGRVSSNAHAALRSHAAGDQSVDHSPIYFRVFPTNACGMRCKMCHIWNTKPVRDLGVHHAVLSRLDSASVLEAVGGEPFLSEAWLQFIAEGLERYPSLRLKAVTNGAYLRGVMMSGGMPPATRWSWIGYSMDAWSQEVTDNLRPGADASALRATLLDLVQYSAGRFTVSVLTLLTRSNLGEIERLVGWIMRSFPGQACVNVALSLVQGMWHGEADFEAGELDEITDICERLRVYGHRVSNLDIVEKMLRDGYARGCRAYDGWRDSAVPLDPRKGARG